MSLRSFSVVFLALISVIVSVPSLRAEEETGRIIITSDRIGILHRSQKVVHTFGGTAILAVSFHRLECLCH